MNISLLVPSFAYFILVVAITSVAVLALLRFRPARKNSHDSRESSASHPAVKTEPAEVIAKTLDAIRPKLLNDSVFLPEPDGIYFQTRGRVSSLKSPGAYDRFTRLLPQMLGNLTVAEICSTLDAEESGAVRSMIATLLERRIVVDHIIEDSELEKDVVDRFASQIEFIEHFADRPVQKFAQFRRSRVLLTGSGTPLRILALSLARNGLETIILDESAADVEHDKEFVSLVEKFRDDHVPLSIERISLKHALSGGQYSLGTICYAADTANFQQMITLNQYSCREKTHFLPGFLLGGNAFVGPFVQAGKTKCWMCALLRYAANLQPELEAQVWRHVAFGLPWTNDSQPESSPSLRILGNLIGFELFRLLVGHIPPETDGAVLSIDLETLESGKSRILAHPLCPHCSMMNPSADRQFLSAASMDNAGENLDLSTKLTVTSVLVDQDFGIAKRFDDDDLLQTPLFRSAQVLSRQPGGRELSIPGFSVQSNASARLDAILSAARAYADWMPDMRRTRFETKRSASTSGLRPVSETRLSGWMGGALSSQEDEAVQWIHAISMQDGTMHLVPAGAVYPRSSFNSGGFEKTNAGIGIGFTFKEACSEAVLSSFAQEILKRVAMVKLQLTELDPNTLADISPDLRYLVNVCHHLNTPFRLLGFRHSCAGTVALACSPDVSTDPNRMTIGAAGHLEQAAVIAMTDFLAIQNGALSLRTAECYLPQSLGYTLNISSRGESPREPDVLETQWDQRLFSVLFAFGNDYSDILIASLASEDLKSAGLTVVRSLFLKRDASFSES